MAWHDGRSWCLQDVEDDVSDEVSDDEEGQDEGGAWGDWGW